MSNFALISSLLNPAVVVEAVQAPPAQDAGFDCSIDQIEFTSTPDGDYSEISNNVEVGVTYTEDGNKYLHLTLSAVLKAEYSEEDDSFDYTYGSIHGTHGGKYGVLGGYKLENPKVPRVEDNMELFTMNPEKMKEIVARITASIVETSEDEILKNINAEAFQNKVEAMFKNNVGYD